MTKDDWDKLSPKEQKHIMDRCKESPAYFYNNYVRKENEKEVTDEEMLEIRRMAETCHIKGRSRHIFRYPPLISECFKKL